MDDQHRKITGYRDLTQEEIDLINLIKDHAVAVEALITKLQSVPIGIIDHRWVAIGKTDLQTGFMALTRAVAQPTTF